MDIDYAAGAAMAAFLFAYLAYALLNPEKF